MDLDCFTVAVPKHRSGSKGGPLANTLDVVAFTRACIGRSQARWGTALTPKFQISSDLFKASALSFMHFIAFHISNFHIISQRAHQPWATSSQGVRAVPPQNPMTHNDARWLKWGLSFPSNLAEPRSQQRDQRPPASVAFCQPQLHSRLTPFGRGALGLFMTRIMWIFVFPEDYSQYISDYVQKLSPRSRVHSTNLNDQLFDCVNVYIMMAPKGCGLETPPLLSAVHVD